MKLQIEGKPALRIKLQRDGNDVQVVAWEEDDTSPWFLLTLKTDGTVVASDFLPCSLGFAVTHSGHLKVTGE